VNETLVRRASLPPARSGWAQGRLFQDAGALAIALAAYVHCAWISWRRWGDLIFDAGREMELPARMAGGAQLYVDVRNLYGPLAPYLNATLFQIFGVHLDVLIAAGLVSAAVMGVGLYLLARRFLDVWPSTLAVVTFFYACAFGHLTSNAIFNFVIPYSYAATYGAVAGCFSLYFLVRHVQASGDGALAFSVVFGLLAFLSKLEVALSVACAYFAYLAGTLWTGRLTRRRIAVVLLGGVGLLAVYGALYLRVGPGLWSDNIFSAASTSGSQGLRPVTAYAMWSMGLDDIGASGLAIVEALLLLAITLGLGLVADWLLRRVPMHGAVRMGFLGGIGVACAGIVARSSVTVPLRMLPVVTLGVLAWLAVLWWREPEKRASTLAHIVLWAYVGGSLSRQLLRVVPEHYGFYLVPVPLVGLGVLLFGYAPGWTRATPQGRVGLRVTASGYLVGVAAGCFLVSSAEYARHRWPLDTPRGSLVLRDDGAQAAIVDALRSFPSGTRAIVVPQGAGFVFMSGLTWGDGTFAYAPSDLTGSYEDANLAKRWSAQPPDVVVFLRLPGGYGAPEFGAGYAMESARWLFENFPFWIHPRGFAIGVRPGTAAAGRPRAADDRFPVPR